MSKQIDELICRLKEEIEQLQLEEKVEMLNKARMAMSQVSPFKEPIDCVIWVKAEKVHANDYNPNEFASVEKKLLYTSIKLDGFTQPVVSYKYPDGDYEVVDGFNRNDVGKKEKDIRERIYGYLPLTVIDKPLEERMGSTIRHNRARGTHQIRAMSDIVIELTKAGWSNEDLCTKLGMDMDEVLRLKQISGLKEAFANHEFSKSWEEFESKYAKKDVE